MKIPPTKFYVPPTKYEVPLPLNKRNSTRQFNILNSGPYVLPAKHQLAWINFRSCEKVPSREAIPSKILN